MYWDKSERLEWGLDDSQIYRGHEQTKLNLISVNNKEFSLNEQPRSYEVQIYKQNDNSQNNEVIVNVNINNINKIIELKNGNEIVRIGNFNQNNRIVFSVTQSYMKVTHFQIYAQKWIYRRL